MQQRERSGRPGTWLEPPQVECLREACYDDAFQPSLHQRNEAIVAVLYDAGLSVGDLVRLDVDHVDFGARTLTVPPPADEADRSPATIPLDPDRSIGTVRLLKSYLYNRSKDAAALFPSRKRTRMTPKAVRDVIRKVARAADIHPCTPDGPAEHDAMSPHTLRHSTAWRVLNVENGDLGDVQRRLRHASRRTTERLYGDLEPGCIAGTGDLSGTDAEGFLDFIPDGFVVLDGDWRVTFLNRFSLEAIEEDAEEVLGRTVWEAFPDLVGTRFEDAFRDAVRCRETIAFEEYYPPTDDWLSVHAYPTGDGLSVHATPVSERRRRERELERYETIFETIVDGVYTLDADLNFDMVNDALVDMSGYSREKLLASDGSLLADEEELERGAKERAALIAGEADSFTHEGEMHTADGEIKPIEGHVSLLPSDDGFAGTVGIVRDVTRQRERERELERYETIIETIDDGVYTLDGEMRFETVNDAFAAMTGYTREELIGSDLSLIVDDATREYGRALREEIRESDLDVASLEVSVFSADDEEIPVEVRFSSLPGDEGEHRTVGVVRNISERKRRERELREEQAFTQSVLDTIPDMFYAVGTDLTFLRWNDQLTDVTGYSGDEVVDMHPLEFIPESDHEEISGAIAKMLNEGLTQTVEAGLLTREGEKIPYEYNGSPITDGTGEIIGLAGTARDITDQREHERTLTALHGSTRELIHAETKAEVCRIIVETATDVLNLSGVITHLYDPETDLLRPAAQDISASEINPPKDLPATDTSLVGHTYTTGETAVFDDVNESDLLRRPSTILRSGLFIPLGRHGTFLAGSTEVGVFDQQTMELADIFAASAEAALDRVEREEELRQRGRTLARQRDELETLNDINVLMQEVRRSMLRASTRKEIERTICEHLADSPFYRYAWVTERDLTGDNLVPATILGIDEGRAREMADIYRETGVETLGERALRTGETEVASTAHDEEWFSAEALTFARRYDYHSTIAVPLTYGSTSYGVLGVVASSPDAFSEREQAAFTTLGETIGFAISAVQNRQLLLTDSVVELEFEGTTDREAVIALARELDCRCVLRGSVAGSDGRLLHYVCFERTTADRIRGALSDSDEFDQFRIVEESDETCLVELEFTGSAPKHLVRAGAHVRTAVVDGGQARFVAEITPDADVRGLVDSFLAAYPGLSLSSKQTIDRPIETAKEFREGIDELLTAKQRTSLQAAYHAGYYEWPRGSTAEEIAESMGVSSPTLHHHLRRSHRKLLQSIFDDGV